VAKSCHAVTSAAIIPHGLHHPHRGELKPSLDRDWQLCTGITREQARALMDAGAKWIGAEFYRPSPAIFPVPKPLLRQT